MTGTSKRPGGSLGTWFLVASGTLMIGIEVAPQGSFGGTRPRCSRRQFGDAAGECGEADLVRVPGRQGEFDPGDHFGDAPGDLDQTEADRVELGIAPERSSRRQAAQ